MYDAYALIKYGSDKCEVTQLTGIGKYPHLLVSSNGIPSSSTHIAGSIEANINFGTVNIGKAAEKWVDIFNLSPVRWFTIYLLYL